MSDWTSTPVIVVAAIAAVTALLGIGRWIGKVGANQSSFKGFIEEIREDIREIKGDIKGILRELPSKVLTSGSPIRLTDFGKKIAEDIGAEEWAKSLAPNLLPKVKDKSQYEIQEFCLEYTTKKITLDESQSLVVENCAYTQGVDTRAVRQVLGIVLRDVLVRNYSRQILKDLRKDKPPS